MPKVIVYVRESDWSALGEGAADRVRGFAADGIRQAVGGPGETLNGSAVQAPSPEQGTQADRGGTAPPGASAPARRRAKTVAYLGSTEGQEVVRQLRERTPEDTEGVRVALGGKRFSGPDLRPSEKKAKR